MAGYGVTPLPLGPTQPLPPKVAETGIGYTLSGKLLDPISSSAHAYGFKPAMLALLTHEQLAVSKEGLIVENLPRELGGLQEGGLHAVGPTIPWIVES